MGTVSYSPENESYDTGGAVSYLKDFAENDCFRHESGDCPVSVCFDVDAVKRIRQGENLKIIVPNDKTLTFVFGILKKKETSLSPVFFPEDAFRSTDGTCKNPLYPPVEAYQSAFFVPDLLHFADATKHSTKFIRRNVTEERVFNSVDSLENILLITSSILLILLWTASALHRSTGKDMYRWILLISMQTVLWLLLSLFKYLLPSTSLLNRICWYSYYLFLMGLPFTLLYVSILAGRLPHKRKIPHWFIPFMVLYPALLLLIFTNDLHQLVFRFDPDGDWNQNYSYGPGYYLIFIYALLSFLLAVLIFIHKSRKSPKKYSWVLPVLVAILLVSFNVCYIMNIFDMRNSNLTLVFCLFSVLFLEVILRTGLLPSNRGYKALFASSPLNMQLLDKEGNTVLMAANAEELTSFQRISILSAPGIPLPKGKNALLHSCRIRGGIALWQEDISVINELHGEIHASIDKLQQANNLLKKANQIRRQKISLDVRTRLFCQLENDIREETEELSCLIHELPASPHRQQQISYLPLLLCHMKRKCNLFFLSREGEFMSSNELALYLDELSEFASYSRLHALVRCGISGSLSVNTVSLMYDFYFFLLRWAVSDSNSVLIGRIEEQKEELSFWILSSESTDSLHFPESFLNEVKTSKGALSFRTVEDSEGIYLNLPKKGGGPL